MLRKTLEDCLKRIDYYINHKSYSIFDDFYQCHLDCFETLVNNELNRRDTEFKVIVEPNGHTYESGVITPNYITICKSPHWGDNEGVLISGNPYDATKFNYEDSDLNDILAYVKSRYPLREFKIISVSKTLFGNTPKEVWDNESVKCDFDKTGMIDGNVVKKVWED